MALLMLKTHDLTWQDHTINVEMMLAPLHAQLLASKHKALSTRCSTVKQIYDKERDTMVKNINIEKRMMERKKNAILQRKSEIAFKRLSSAKSDPTDTRCHTIPDINTKRGKSAPPILGDVMQKQSEFFLTEVQNMDMKGNNLNSEQIGGRKGSVSEPFHTVSSSRNSVKSSVTLPYFTGIHPTSRIESPRYLTTGTTQMQGKSVRFEDTDEEERNSEILFEKINYARLQQKVKTFVNEQDNFNKRPTGYTLNFRAKQRFAYNPFNKNNGKKQQPLVAKKSTKLSLDKSELERAFDKFCQNKTKDNLHSMMKMATKQKASIRIARDQSIVPAIAVKRSANKFLSNLGKNKASEQKDGGGVG
ncbi:uncharacterized protein LOC134279018 [Saccostrea cucullata]|uniref:uncharacterized protein LOC134279018 n=1 Tax=Saccostrea cuccullata TaxID=36930 RepID=UPI002ED51ADC